MSAGTKNKRVTPHSGVTPVSLSPFQMTAAHCIFPGEFYLLHVPGYRFESSVIIVSGITGAEKSLFSYR